METSNKHSVFDLFTMIYDIHQSSNYLPTPAEYLVANENPYYCPRLLAYWRNETNSLQIFKCFSLCSYRLISIYLFFLKNIYFLIFFQENRWTRFRKWKNKTLLKSSFMLKIKYKLVRELKINTARWKVKFKFLLLLEKVTAQVTLEHFISLETNKWTAEPSTNISFHFLHFSAKICMYGFILASLGFLLDTSTQIKWSFDANTYLKPN